MATLLLATVLLPLGGALVIVGNREVVRGCALVTTLLTLAAAAILISQYPAGADDFAATPDGWRGWIGGPADIHFDLALDGLSLWLFGLTALLTVVAVLVSWEAIGERAALYYRLLLTLETGMLGVFVARDVVLFYVFFEFTLIPLFLLIGIWGGRRRRYAAIKFFLFTLAGSVLTFLGLLAIVLWDYYHPIGDPAAWKMTFSTAELTGHLAKRPMDAGVQLWIFLALFAGFATRVPLLPLHTWLPLAQVEAPAAGGVLLAGVLLKVGTYGFVRFSLPMLPDATVSCMPYLLWLSAAGIIYGALVALAQSDVKRLIAYSSISHLGFCTLGVFAANRLGVQGGVLQMVGHGLATGGLLALVGMLYQRDHTRQIARPLGGDGMCPSQRDGDLARQTPLLAFFMLVLILSSIGLPGLVGFVGQLLPLLGIFQRGDWAQAATFRTVQYRVIAVSAVAGLVLGAWYMSRLVGRVFFGAGRQPKLGAEGPPVRDLCLREVLALSPLVVFVFWIGLQPQFFLDRISPTLEKTFEVMRAAEERTPENSGRLRLSSPHLQSAERKLTRVR